MPFSRYVEIGRVALVSYGAEYGKLVVIVDVVDQNRVSDGVLTSVGGLKFVASSSKQKQLCMSYLQVF
jgi:ribosomal protein L14E/L6E/L27E